MFKRNFGEYVLGFSICEEFVNFFVMIFDDKFFKEGLVEGGDEFYEVV